MKKILATVFMMVLVGLALTGCTREKSSLLPSHDEVLEYPLPFDLVYLRTMEAVDSHPDWELDFTEKEKGIIAIHNQRFSSYGDADLRFAELRVKRVSRAKTSVEFSPESRSVVGGDEILKLIKQSLSTEVGQRS